MLRISFLAMLEALVERLDYLDNRSNMVYRTGSVSRESGIERRDRFRPG